MKRLHQKGRGFFLKVLFFSLLSLNAIVFTACNSVDVPDRVKVVLDKAGKNRGELENVISYYSKSPEDSLKLKAAYFLIENMDGQRTLDTTSTESNQIYFDQMNAFWEKTQAKLNILYVSGIVDSLNKAKGITHPVRQVKYVPDYQYVSSKFLINNIDKAFYVWRTMPWSKQVSFKDFCEYILPYRCTDTYYANTRDFFLKHYKAILKVVGNTNNCFDVAKYIISDIDNWLSEDLMIFVRYPYLHPLKFEDLLKGKVGECKDVNSVKIMALRSLGVPAALDQIPNWGNSDSSHYWYKIIDPKHDPVDSLLTNENVRRNTQNIITGSSYDVYPDYKGIPKGIQRIYIRSVSKVYREAFAKQSNSLACLKSFSEEIPSYFRDDRLADVTNLYVDCTDIKIELENSIPNQRFVYLCVFDNVKWNPVAWGTINNGFATVKSVGKNIVYLPVAYYNSHFVPLGAPFLLNLKGQVERFVAGGKTETVRLNTKFPLRSHVGFWESFMIGTRFQLANKADFSDSVTVHTIKEHPYYGKEIKVNTPKKYRYLIYQFKKMPIVFVAELEFYGLNAHGKEVKLTGKLIGNSGMYPYTIDKAIDGDRETYFYSQGDKVFYIAIDLGAGNEKRVTRIRFVPRSDDNAVVMGEMFELFYWDRGWVSLGKKEGDRNGALTFSAVPRNALLLLKDTKRGKENRIFIYKNSQQQFW